MNFLDVLKSRGIVLLLGADFEYFVNKNTGVIFYHDKSDKIKICKIGSNNAERPTYHVILLMNGKRTFFSYHKLIALVNYGVTDLIEIKKTISDHSVNNILRKIVIQDNDYRNGSSNNIHIAENMWVKFYYDHIVNKMNDIDLTGLSTPLVKGDLKYVNEKSVSLVPLENNNIYITSRGLILNIKSGYVGYGYISSCGYKSYAVVFKNKNTVFNTNRLMWLAFIDSEISNETLITYKDNCVDRTITDITKLTSRSRSECTKKYHNDNPDHFEKYLKDYTYNIKNLKPVHVNGKKFESITEAAKYIAKKENKTVSSIKSLISLRMRNKIDANKLIYKKYKISVDKD